METIIRYGIPIVRNSDLLYLFFMMLYHFNAAYLLGIKEFNTFNPTVRNH